MKRTVVYFKDKKYKSCMGINDTAPNRTHYFLEEETPFSVYFIRHLNKVPENKYIMKNNVDH